MQYRLTYMTQARVEVQIPIKPKTAGGAVSTRLVSFDEDISSGDFLSRVCAYMDLPLDEAQLGYKWNFERRRDPPHRLLTCEDIKEAFEKAIQLSSSKRRKEVIMEIVDLVSSVAL